MKSDVDLEPGKYVVAVSGGVDSVVLLDLLAKNKNLELVVAHFDHGMRGDSNIDRKFVEKLSKRYGLPFYVKIAKLGKDASEETARDARYKFLYSVLESEGADAIITAHHQDDVIETIILNILRGTGRKGVTSLKNRNNIIRPLLDYQKNSIKEYAKDNGLDWVEDPTNETLDYARNWVRQKLIPKMGEDDISQLIKLYEQHNPMNDEIDVLIKNLIDTQKPTLDKAIIIGMEYMLACELVAEWLRANNLKEFDKKTIDRIVRGAKTLPAGKKINVYAGKQILIENSQLKIIKNAQGKENAIGRV